MIADIFNMCYNRFEGEDLSSKERLKAQREQFRSWLEQQVAERKAADNDRKVAQAAFDDALIARDKRACELDKMEQECRRRLDEANLRFNIALVSYIEIIHFNNVNQGFLYNF